MGLQNHAARRRVETLRKSQRIPRLDHFPDGHDGETRRRIGGTSTRHQLDGHR